VNFEEWRINREGIYVEHGNQYADFISRVRDMEDPRKPDRPDQLDLPLSSWLLMEVLNEVERDRYWIDGVKPITALIWYALAYDFPFAARTTAALIRGLPGFIIGVVSAAGNRSAKLVRALEDPARVKKLTARYEADPSFRQDFNAQLARTLPLLPENGEPSVHAMRAILDSVAMGQQVQSQMHDSLYRFARRRAAEERAKLVVFGHTHDAGVHLMLDGGTYINSGTWTWRADFTGEGKESWRELFMHPDRFTDDRRLSYVRIDYTDGGEPVGRLMEYRAPANAQPGSSAWKRMGTWLGRNE
jgi:hypothetical protein